MYVPQFKNWMKANSKEAIESSTQPDTEATNDLFEPDVLNQEVQVEGGQQ